MTGYDIIGDIHGHYDELITLLTGMKYRKKDEVYVHPEGRLPIFVGDLIDRGPKIRETIEFVKNMVDNKLALCIAGNHEYNAVNFWKLTKNSTGYYRKHCRANIIQHFATIKAFQNRDEEWETYLKWMENLPIIIEMDNFRVVHASYHPSVLKMVNKISQISKNPNYLIQSLSREGDDADWHVDDKLTVQDITEKVLKGTETKLPDGIHFYDKDKTKRTKARIKWWLKPQNNTYNNYLEPLAGQQAILKDMPVDVNLIDSYYLDGYSENEKPVYFGHYWLQMNNDTGQCIQ